MGGRGWRKGGRTRGDGRVGKVGNVPGVVEGRSRGEDERGRVFRRPMKRWEGDVRETLVRRTIVITGGR